VEGEDPRRGVLTYSIVARDAETGELGAAVQSRAFTRGAGRALGEAGRRRGRHAVVRGTEHQLGDGFSVQANPMRNTSVWPTMRAFEAAACEAASRGAARSRGGPVAS
jgi:uncharacterized Ntn-hydrolase superfamily protein